MQGVVSNLDSVIFAVPLVGLLVTAMFRVDELVGQPIKPVRHRRQVSGLDANGFPRCLDPDGRMPGRKCGKLRRSL